MKIAMKLTFDTKNDFNSTYYLPGYGCEVHIEVKNGIVNLNIEDDEWEQKDDEDIDWDYEDEDWEVENVIELVDDDSLDEEWLENDAEEVEEENLDNDLYKGENVVGDFDSCGITECHAYGFTCEDASCNETKDTSATTLEVENDDVEKSKTLIEKLAKVDTDGTVMKLLTELINSGKVSDLDSKAGKTFKKILNNIGNLLKD